MKAKRTVGMWILMCVGSLATGAMGLTYTWTDGGAGDGWSTGANWDIVFCQPGECYPNDTNDDAVFPADAGWECDLITVLIDDLTIADDVDFGAASSGRVLSVETLTIIGPAVVTMTEATIRTY